MSNTSRRRAWWNSRPATVPAIVFDAAFMFGAILLFAALIDDEGWRGGLGYASGFAGFRLVLNSFLLWNNREPSPR